MPRAKKKVHNSHEQEAEAYVVAVDATFFLNWKGDDWTEKLFYARRFMKANEADAWAQEVQAKHPKSHVRVCRLWMAFLVSEL